jgi:hypothetical protein
VTYHFESELCVSFNVCSVVWYKVISASEETASSIFRIEEQTIRKIRGQMKERRGNRSASGLIDNGGT